MNKIKVLILEDDRLIAENNKVLLQGVGYEVSGTCTTASQAEESIAANRPDIVLIDILLKGEKDGIWFANRLRNKYDIPFVYATSNSDPNTLERAKLTAPYGFIIKPFETRDLQSNIEMALYKYNTESRVEKLNEILYALNDLNRLEVNKSDADEFIEGACRILTRFPSFSYVWACRIDEKQNLIAEYQASPKDSIEFSARPIQENGTLADCILGSLRSSSALAHLPGSDTCTECSLANQFSESIIITSRIASEEQVFGCLVAVIPAHKQTGNEFLHLLSEYTRKIGNRLRTLSSQQQLDQTEQALIKSTSQLRQLTDIVRSMIFFLEPDFTINYVNTTVIHTLGYQQAELKGAKAETVLSKEALPYLDEWIRSLKRGEFKARQIEVTLQSKSGEPIPVLLSTTPITKEEQLTSIVILAYDLRDQKTEQDHLLKLSHVLDQNPAAILMTDYSGRITYVNQKFVTMTGFFPEEVKGQFPAILKTDDITNTTATDLIQTVKGGGVWRGELRTYRANKEKFWAEVTVSGISDADGNYSYIGIIDDISEKKAAQTDLEHTRQSFTDVFNATSDAIYILNKQGQFIDVNQGACKMYGYEKEFFLGKTPADLSAEGKNDLPAVQKALVEAYHGKPQRFEFWGKRKNGEIFPKDVQLNRIRYFDAKAVIATSRDISEQKRQARELENALRHAERSELLKSLILANMNHEIRTPLSSMVGYIDLLFHDLGDAVAEKTHDYFNIIRRNSDRLTHTIDTIIDLAQIETGNTKLIIEEVNLVKLVEAARIDQKREAEQKQLGFTFHRPEGDFFILADQKAIHTSISSIIENAITYTNQGKIDIFLEHAPGGGYQLEIRDTGIGIAKENTDTIFESFMQESMGYTKKYQGLGLGLTLARKSLELLQCQITVKSKKGEGSSFYIFFPEKIIVQHQPAVTEPVPNHGKTTPAMASTKQNNVLIVEDDKNAQRLFGLFLKNDYQVHLASTVAEGKACLAENPVNLVVTDLSLIGGEDGIDLVKWIRQQPQFKELPVLALTAHAMESDRMRCLDAGCNDFVTKPIFRDQLRKKLKSFLK